jgi:hypothetical protein
MRVVALVIVSDKNAPPTASIFSWEILINMLVFHSMITKNGGLDPPMVNVPETPCWHSLALLLGLLYPSNSTKECQSIGHNIYIYYLEAHESIIVAFHLEVFGYRSFIFSQRKAWCKVSRRDLDKIT